MVVFVFSLLRQNIVGVFLSPPVAWVFLVLAARLETKRQYALDDGYWKY